MPKTQETKQVNMPKAMPVKNDGSKDKRYVNPQVIKSDGSRDMRTKLTSTK